ncbi:cellulose synthase family protein [Algoriphagus boritolerans]|uniref:Glycosyltransferase, catalytic subunit of cellulose synthase and poly-beta-1,6-N-acetylglucosamine synthase n=1 Tax=Algoriphagus boritolerans DSM 17298 = JCM 18970 TaxID=1120964 RepID=A0A1H5WK83_9BACT|nr:cellulose synthase family protein [Algoriphagus boritolerans]SEF99773.1 Glycosyltransferase, catalytic subunit of cellulose synthase and poly-beta-1,6-N-acetylglucosamine synthase [Algoriphagus boritolerans DSM 17298 = JCM 18970]
MIFLYFLCGLYFLGMLFILIYSLAQGHLLFHFLKAQRSWGKIAKKIPKDWPSVTVQLPVYNELYVVERLIEAVAKLNYPRELLEIQLLDDSTDQTVDLIREKLKNYPEINFQYIHRRDRTGFKAGALREGLKVASGEFIAIFDADFVPSPDFLLQTIPYFSSEKVGMVQTRWTHLNRDFSLLTKLQAFALDAHFFIEQVGRNHQGAFINFNGTGGIWRKSCILDAGNWHDDTLTEDLDLSYRAQRKGWKFVYRPEIESPAELPPIMSAIKSQQFRWTKGGAECAVKHAGAVSQENLSFRIKLHSFAHLFNSTIFIAVLLTSLSSIGVWWAGELGLVPDFLVKLSGIFLIGFVVIAGVYLVSYFYGKKSFVQSALGVIWQLPLFLSVSMGLALHNAQAVWEGLSGRKSPFIRTPKFNLESGKEKLSDNRYLLHRMPVTTWFEGVLALVFWAMVGLAFREHNYLFLPFHVMLAFGYSLVFITSFKSYGLGR